jgi:hypothetical protein
MLIMLRVRALALATLIMLLCCSASARQRRTGADPPIDKGSPGIEVTCMDKTGCKGGYRLKVKNLNSRFIFSLHRHLPIHLQPIS